MKRAIIIHGFKGKPETNWKPWLRDELMRKGFTVQIPAMPNTDAPNVNEWLSKLKETIGNFELDELYLIGHSLGCITILHYLQSLHAKEHVHACIFVGGFTRPFKEYAHGHDIYFEEGLNFKRIKRHSDTFTAIHSKDDPNVGFEELAIFKSRLNAKLIPVEGMGHFGSADGVFEVPVVLDAVLNAQ